jgi:hypothetical protein
MNGLRGPDRLALTSNTLSGASTRTPTSKSIGTSLEPASSPGTWLGRKADRNRGAVHGRGIGDIEGDANAHRP